MNAELYSCNTHVKVLQKAEVSDLPRPGIRGSCELLDTDALTIGLSLQGSLEWCMPIIPALQSQGRSTVANSRPAWLIHQVATFKKEKGSSVQLQSM